MFLPRILAGIIRLHLIRVSFDCLEEPPFEESGSVSHNGGLFADSVETATGRTARGGSLEQGTRGSVDETKGTSGL